jgi:hypothetical protein
MTYPVSIGKNLTAGSLNTVYTVPTGYSAIWNLLYIHNAGGNTKSMTVNWYDKSANIEIAILDSYSFASKLYFEFNGNGSGVALDEGDEIRMTPDAASTFSAICTLFLQRKNNGNV